MLLNAKPKVLKDVNNNLRIIFGPN